jgi:Protein of unknown function (DUF3800)
MYLLYVDESGVTNPDSSQTSHYVLIGLAVHVGTWFALTRRVRELKGRYALDGNTEDLELHAAWMLRAYREQSIIPSFADLGFGARHDAMKEWRATRQANDWPGMRPKDVHRERKEFRKTEAYIHLTREERSALYLGALRVVAEHRRGVVLFGEAIEKACLPRGVDTAEEAFTRLVDRFEIFLQNHQQENPWGIVVVDRDSATENRFAAMLARLQQQEHARGGVDRVIESPFFLDSRANAGVQVADLCAYAVRRYLENGEREQFEIIFPRFFRKDSALCGLRHFTTKECKCLICTAPKAELERKERRSRKKSKPVAFDPANVARERLE